MKRKNFNKNTDNKNSKGKGEAIPDETAEHKKIKSQLKNVQESSETAKSEIEDIINKLQLIIDSMPAVIGYINTEYKFQFANKFFKKFLNVNPSDIIGKHIKDVVGVKAFAKVKPKYDEAFAGVRQEFETLVPYLDGHLRLIQATFVPHKVKGKVEGTFIFVQDISKRKQDEEELKEAKNALEKANLELSEALELGVNQFNLFADNLPGNVFIKNDKLEYIFLNKNSLNVYNLKEKDINGLTTHDLFSENIANKLQEVDKEVQSKKQGIENELKTSGINKNEKWEKFIKFPITMPNGKIFVGGFALDITQEKQRSRLIINSELRYRSLFEGARDAIMIVDFDKIIDVNQSTLKKFGYKDKSEIINKLVVDISPKTQPDGSLSKVGIQKFIKKVMAGEPQLFNWKHKRKDGTELYTQVSLNQFTYNDKKYILASVRDISKKVAIEKEIIKAKENAEISEKYLFNIINNIGDPVFVVDEQSTFLLVNDAFCNLLGLTRGNILGDTLAEYFPAEEMEGFLRDNKQVLETGQESIIEELITLKGGETKTVYTKKTRYIDNSGKKYIIGVIRDITDRKLAEENVKETLLQLNLAVDTAKIGVWSHNIATNELVWNSELFEIFGITQSEFDNSVDVFTNMVHPEDLDVVMEQYNKAFQNKSVAGFNYRIIRPNKEVRYLYASVTPILDNEKNLIKVTGINLDVTEAKVSEEALIESKTKFEILSKVTFEGILIHDNGISIDVNNSFPKMFGYTKDEFINKDLVKLIIKKDHQNIILENVKNEYTLPYEVIGVKKDGTEFPIEIEGKTYISENNKKLRVAAIRDITERKLSEESVKQALSQLNLAVDTAKIGVWSHDIVTDEVVWNSELFKIFGITPSEFDYSMETFKSMVHPEDLENLMEQQGQIFQNKPVTDLNFRIIRPNKEVRYILASITPILDEEKKLIKITGINLDVTESKIAEDALRESEKKFKSLFESSANLVLVTNLKGEILEINRLEEGYNKEDIIRSNITDHLSKSESLDFKKVVKNVLKNGKTDSYEALIKTPSNEDKYWHNSVSLINDANQGPRLLVSSTDITEVKNAEKELEVALDEITELKQKLEAENIYLKEELKLEGSFEEIIGSTKSLSKVLKQVEQVAKTDTTVLVLGETGTGKELIAKAIHKASNRKDKPLVKVNCSALPAELIESELFGHEKGSFTGALNRKIGRFELANGGTIFLDEIGDIPLDLQTRLLRVLQESEFERVGGQSTIKVDVRLITATNRNLEELLIEGKFRQDLYYRLNVFPITSPKLRERLEDIPSLVNHFVLKYNHKVNNKIKTIDKSSIEKLMKYDWPGNIRELEHVIERAIILNQGEKLRLGNWFVKDGAKISLPNKLITLEELERNHIKKVLKESKWKIRGRNGAAEILGLKPTTLESRIKKLKINRNN